MELLTGVIVAIAAVALVLEPLFANRTRRITAPTEDLLDFQDPHESDSPRVKALLALKEIEFDRATGKLSDADYVRLKREYGRAALNAMDAEPGAAGAAADDDAVERAIAEFRDRGPQQCPGCGERPEATAIFCSSCGRLLGESDARPRCWECGAELDDEARFCGVCGVEVAA